MNNDRQAHRRRHYLSESEKLVLCQQWHASCQTKSAFCQQHNLSIASFSKWSRKYLLENNQVPTNNAHEKCDITSAGAHQESSCFQTIDIMAVNDNHQRINILLPNGVQLLIPFTIENISQLMKELCHADTTLRS